MCVAALGRDDGEGGVWCGNREDSWIGVWLAGTAAPCIALSGDVSPDGLTLAFVDGPWEVGGSVWENETAWITWNWAPGRQAWVEV